MKVAAWFFSKSGRYNLAGKLTRWALRRLPRWMIYNRLNVWGKERELPPSPKKSFKEWYRENYPEKDKQNENINNQ